MFFIIQLIYKDWLVQATQKLQFCYFIETKMGKIDWPYLNTPFKVDELITVTSMVIDRL